MSVAVLIPFVSEDKDRIAAFKAVCKWWKDNFGFQVVKGIADPYTKGAALSDAAARARADIYCIADADCILQEPWRITEIVKAIEAGQFEWAVPHGKVHRLTEEATNDYYARGDCDITDIHYPPYTGCKGGGLVVLSRRAWEEVGGIEPRFVGWGGEDVAFGYALELLVGKPHIGNGRLIHLWHEEQGPKRPMSPYSLKLIELYQEARYSPAKMRELIAQRS